MCVVLKIVDGFIFFRFVMGEFLFYEVVCFCVIFEVFKIFLEGIVDFLVWNIDG